ncbi:MAG TPA: ribosome-binding factor A [Candidatus Megaira endosymbiont of Hartmannula sinica]|nr:ribosome-binding factor A [Candidatus Megaera endosymbiont of Hartmannula sinica]
MKNVKFKKLVRFNKKESPRQMKIARLIHLAINECLNKKIGPIDNKFIENESNFLTITKVLISPDLKIASCYFIPFNTKYNSEEIQKSLENSEFAIKKYISKSIRLKYVPLLKFFYDYNESNSYEINDLLNKINIEKKLGN